MKSLRKNGYAIVVIAFFAIAVAMLVLFLALFSSSTAVDGTTVGSVYIGDQKPNTEARKKKLIDGVQAWQKDARYTISFQNYSYTIGRTDRTDEKGDPMYDPNTGEQLFDDVGLAILDFDYEKTNTNIIPDSSDNDAVFSITDENKTKLFEILKNTFGTTVTDDIYFEYDKLVNAILKDADEMNTKCDYDLYDYLKIGWVDDLVSQVDIENLTKEKVDFLYEIFEGKQIVIAPQKSSEGKLGFSTVEFFSRDEFAEVGLTSSDMSIIATGFAAVVQPTSLTVTVKNQGYISDKYYAYDFMTARVNIKDGTDLRIMNPETHEYVITIEKGEKIIDGKTSLKFKLNGCQFVNKYSITKNTTTLDDSVKIVYDEYANDDLEYDKNYKSDYNGGCYYMIYQEGIPTVLYSYTKTTTYVNGETSETEVYPKQEFFVGQDELRHWSSKDYKA
jgi:hypothetical protein